MVVWKSHIQAENGMLITGLNSEFLLLKKKLYWVSIEMSVSSYWREIYQC